MAAAEPLPSLVDDTSDGSSVTAYTVIPLPVPVGTEQWNDLVDEVSHLHSRSSWDIGDRILAACPLSPHGVRSGATAWLAALSEATGLAHSTLARYRSMAAVFPRSTREAVAAAGVVLPWTGYRWVMENTTHGPERDALMEWLLSGADGHIGPVTLAVLEDWLAEARGLAPSDPEPLATIPAPELAEPEPEEPEPPRLTASALSREQQAVYRASSTVVELLRLARRTVEQAQDHISTLGPTVWATEHDFDAWSKSRMSAMQHLQDQVSVLTHMLTDLADEHGPTATHPMVLGTGSLDGVLMGSDVHLTTDGTTTACGLPVSAEDARVSWGSGAAPQCLDCADAPVSAPAGTGASQPATGLVHRVAPDGATTVCGVRLSRAWDVGLDWGASSSKGHCDRCDGDGGGGGYVAAPTAPDARADAELAVLNTVLTPQEGARAERFYQPLPPPTDLPEPPPL